MSMELDDKKQFLSQCPPFSSLSSSSLDQVLKKLEISYERAGSSIAPARLESGHFMLRSGSVEVKDSNGHLIDRLSSGDGFGFQSYQQDSSDRNQIAFLEDSLVYQFPRTVIENLSQENSTFALFFEQERAERLHSTLGQKGRDYRLNQRVSELMITAPLCTHESASILDASRSMSQAKVSSILIVDNESLTGIMTDRDLRSRVLAQNVDSQQSVSEVMTRHPRTVNASQTVYEAQLLMMSENIHHLPVVDQNRPVGIITLNDFIRAQNSEPVYMIQAINRARNRDSLAGICKQLPDLICKMIRANERAEEVGRIITSITDSVTRQLIHLATQSLGPAPCDYAWVVFGSQARQDQMLGSDQDNGLILADEVSEQDRVGYFKVFAEFINGGLDKSGLRYCPGDIMAMTDKWRQPLKQWRQYFTRWIREPEPKALMHASIFYDLRHVDGVPELTRNLKQMVLEEASKNTIFQACMSENALQSSPPLGFFKTFVLEKDGNHNPVLDLKLRGTVPIVSLVRLYCLAHGITEVNTSDRLRALERQKVLSHSQVSNLLDAHEFIASLRLESQSAAIAKGEESSNNLNPDELSPLVRHQLKDAFSVVAESQRSLKMRFGHGAL
jgi:CBS domain-containing protein